MIKKIAGLDIWKKRKEKKRKGKVIVKQNKSGNLYYYLYEQYVRINISEVEF